MLTAISLCLLIGLSGFVLSRYQARLSRAAGHSPQQQLSDKINQALPGLHCGQCGYPGCEPYAQAIANGQADINLCSPGGDDLVGELATMLGQNPVPARRASPGQQLNTSLAHSLAQIRSSDCIGCTLCIDACPVDAIIGAPGYLHTVITDRCTGCQLCLPPCPTDCIVMVQPTPHVREWEWPWVDPERDPPQAR